MRRTEISPMVVIPDELEPTVLALLYALRGADSERRKWASRHMLATHWAGGAEPFSFELAHDFALERGLVVLRKPRVVWPDHLLSNQETIRKRRHAVELLYATSAGHSCWFDRQRLFCALPARSDGFRCGMLLKPRLPPKLSPHDRTAWLYGFDCWLLTRQYVIPSAPTF